MVGRAATVVGLCAGFGGCADEPVPTQVSAPGVCEPVVFAPRCEGESCGNGVIDPCTETLLEDCDGDAIEHTCAALGYVGGSLGCDSRCRYDRSDCHICLNDDRATACGLVPMKPAPAGRPRAAVGFGRIALAFSSRTVEGTHFTLVDARRGDAVAAAARPSAPQSHHRRARTTVGPMIEALEGVHPVGDRGRVVRWGDHLIIADCYNANPGSMQTALRSLAELDGTRSGPRVAVVGDMLELGPTENELHAEVGRQAAALGLELVAFGDRMRHAADTARAEGGAASHFADLDALVSALRSRFDDADAGAILLKASRGVKLERVLDALLSPRPG